MYDNKIKKAVKRFLVDKNTTLTPELLVKRLYRNYSLEEAEDLLEDMVSNKTLVKELLEDGGYVYYRKHTPKKSYYY